MKKNYDPAILWPGLFIGLCAVHPLFLIAVFMSVYKYQNSWAGQINQQFSDYKWWYFGFSIFAFLIGYLKNSPFVLDDLMMHVVAYKFYYDYNTLYVHASPLIKFSPSIGFQIIAREFYKLFGPEYSVRVIQLIAVILFYSSFFLALNKILRGDKNKWLWCTIIFALCAPLNIRVFLARPDVFFTAWLMAAVFLRPIAWLLLGILIMPAYWLAIIYAPAAILLDTTWRKKIIYATVYSISCLIFWAIYSEGEWLKMPQLLSEWANNRTGIVYVAEFAQSIGMISSIYLSALLILLFYLLHRASFKLTARAILFCLLIAYFLLPNYIRYMLVVVPLIGLLCALYVPKEIKFNPTLALIVLIFSSLITSTATPTNYQYADLPKFKMPKSAIVLTQFDTAIGSAVLHNPQAKFAPAMDIGANDKAVQKLVGQLHQGDSLNCAELKKLSFTHVQENSLKMIPSCLSISQVDGAWRLWEIK